MKRRPAKLKGPSSKSFTLGNVNSDTTVRRQALQRHVTKSEHTAIFIRAKSRKYPVCLPSEEIASHDGGGP